MRALWLTLPALGLANVVALAQQPPVPDPGGQQLGQVLVGWEKAMTSIHSLYAEVHRTTVDKVFKSTEVFKGTAKYQKSSVAGQQSRAALELYKETKEGLRQDVFEKYICSGNFLYEYVPANKTIRVHELPPPKAGQVGDDNLLNFLFGMKAADAQQRYQLSLEPPPPNDQWYHYVKVQPKLPQDKAEFTVARLVLMRSNSMPRQVWFHSPNGNETTWDFPRMQTNVEIPVAHFAQPQLPKGWQWERMPAQGKLKVRSNTP